VFLALIVLPALGHRQIIAVYVSESQPAVGEFTFVPQEGADRLPACAVQNELSGGSLWRVIRST
jgi:hypothetical protein